MAAERFGHQRYRIPGRRSPAAMPMEVNRASIPTMNAVTIHRSRRIALTHLATRTHHHLLPPHLVDVVGPAPPRTTSTRWTAFRRRPLSELFGVWWDADEVVALDRVRVVDPIVAEDPTLVDVKSGRKARSADPVEFMRFDSKRAPSAAFDPRPRGQRPRPSPSRVQRQRTRCDQNDEDDGNSVHEGIPGRSRPCPPGRIVVHRGGQDVDDPA